MTDSKSYTTTPIRILTILGQWHPEGLKGISKILYTLYKIISAFYISVVFATSEWLDLIHLMIIGGDVDKITNNLTHAVSHGLGVLKHINYLTKTERIRKLIYDIRNIDSVVYEKWDSFDPDSIIAEGYKKIQFSTFVLGGFASTFITVGALAPIFTQLNDYNYYSNSTIYVVRPLPMSSWFPFDTNVFPNYYFAFSYQVLGLFGISWMIVSLDNLFVDVVVEITAQLKILNEALTTIKERSVYIVSKSFAKASVNTPADIDSTNEDRDVLSALEDEEIIKQLKMCIYHHQKIMILCKETESIFSINVLGQFMAGSIIICVSLFQCATRPFSLDFAYMLAYLITISFQLFLYCWFGNELIFESNLLSNAMYKSDWINENESYKKIVSIVMLRGIKPLKLTALGYVPISTQTYTSVMNAAYSYFAILRQIYNK